jgi:hypothetical protein
MASEGARPSALDVARLTNRQAAIYPIGRIHEYRRLLCFRSQRPPIGSLLTDDGRPADPVVLGIVGVRFELSAGSIPK